MLILTDFGGTLNLSILKNIKFKTYLYNIRNNEWLDADITLLYPLAGHCMVKVSTYSI